MEENKITINMEEYKELLIIKGRYEELKERQSICIPTVYKDNNENKQVYDFGEITCNL